VSDTAVCSDADSRSQRARRLHQPDVDGCLSAANGACVLGNWYWQPTPPSDVSARPSTPWIRQPQANRTLEMILHGITIAPVQVAVARNGAGLSSLPYRQA
jgi:hypothetical protein